MRAWISLWATLFVPPFAGTAHGAITVASDFPGGSAAVASIDQQQAIIRLDPTDHPGRGWSCWWYARLEHLPSGQDVTLDVGQAPWATPDRATYSVDEGKTWLQSDPGTRDGKRIRYTLRFDTPTALVAWGPPFVPADAANLVQRTARESPDATAFNLCQTRENRPTPALRVTSAAQNGQAGERPLVWIQARQHAWESGSSWIAKGFVEWLVSDAPEAVRLRESCEVVVVPVMDIDNVYRGAGGKSQAPQDHNRDWSDQPHWRAVAAAQKELRTAAAAKRLIAFVDLHNPSANDRAPYFYLPADELLTESAHANLRRFVDVAQEEITGPLAFQGNTLTSGKDYDPQAWLSISKNWVARLGTSAVAVTLETPWNTPHSTTTGYETVGQQLGKTLARYCETTARTAAHAIVD